MTATKTILYVEDSSYNLLLVKAILGSRKEYQLLTAPTASHGIILSQQQRIDLVLLDLNLPDMSGEEFLARFRLVPGCECVPIIVVSGESIPDRIDRLTQLGVAEILFKPFDIDQFERMIDQRLAEIK